jgi:hypothetical protein
VLNERIRDGVEGLPHRLIMTHRLMRYVRDSVHEEEVRSCRPSCIHACEVPIYISLPILHMHALHEYTMLVILILLSSLFLLREANLLRSERLLRRSCWIVLLQKEGGDFASRTEFTRLRRDPCRPPLNIDRKSKKRCGITLLARWLRGGTSVTGHHDVLRSRLKSPHIHTLYNVFARGSDERTREAVSR